MRKKPLSVSICESLFLAAFLVPAAHAGLTYTITNTVNYGNAPFHIGQDSTNDTLTISDVGVLTNVSLSKIGNNTPDHTNNHATVLGPSAKWYVTGELSVGYASSKNSMTITNSGYVHSGNGELGNNAAAGYNTVRINGPGSIWTNDDAVVVGHEGFDNTVWVENGGALHAVVGRIGFSAGSSNNTVFVVGPGTEFTCERLRVGFNGNNSSFLVGGTAKLLADNVIVGFMSPSYGNILYITSGGNLLPKNPSGGNVLDIRRGRLVLDGGEIVTDNLFSTNGVEGQVEFRTGILRVRDAQIIDNGAPLQVGNGVQPATYNMLGGTNVFSDGLVVTGNGLLNGNGYASDVTVQLGGTVSPGESVGLISGSNLVLQAGSKAVFELGATNTSDKIVLQDTLTLNGQEWNDFTFTNLPGFGPGKYVLIDAASITGSLGAITNGTIDGIDMILSVDTINQDLVLDVSPFLFGVGSTGTAVNVSGGMFDFDFAIQSGAHYRVQATVDLLDPAGWQDISSPLTNNTGDLLDYIDPDTAIHPLRMFRISSP